VMAIPHPYGRLQFGADLDLHFRTLIGAGCNPNVAAVVVIGIEEGWTKRVVDGIAATGKPVEGFGIELHGDHDTIMRASKAARVFVQQASEKPGKKRLRICRIFRRNRKTVSTSFCPQLFLASFRIRKIPNSMLFSRTGSMALEKIRWKRLSEVFTSV